LIATILKLIFILKLTYFRFKPKGQEDILITNPETRILEMHFDPALAQGVYRIINEFSYAAHAAN
jgi:hypothetical protein